MPAASKAVLADAAAGCSANGSPTAAAATLQAKPATKPQPFVFHTGSSSASSASPHAAGDALGQQAAAVAPTAGARR